MVTVNEILDKAQTLPALPQTVLRVVSLLSEECPPLGDVRDLIRMDEAIASTVLRIANSVAFGSPGKIFSLEQSIIRLGSRNLLKIALEQQVSGLLDSGGASYGLRRGALWKGAIGGALAVEEFAKEVSFKDAELCFICELLRDIGKLALDSNFSASEILACHEQIRPEQNFLDAERETLGIDHAELGGALAERWGLPQRIADTIRYHHLPPAPDEDHHDELFDLVHAADVISLWMGLAIGHDGLQYPLAPHVQKSLLGSRKRAEQIMARTWPRIEEFEESMKNQAS